jgi:flagellum-specific ATP synthase
MERMISERFLNRSLEAVRAQPKLVTLGRVARVTGLLVEAHVPSGRISDIVAIDRDGGSVQGEIVGFRDDLSLLIPLSDVRGIAPGALVRKTGLVADIPASDALLGRAIDPFGIPVDGGPPVLASGRVPVDRAAPAVSGRAQIKERFDTGVRAIDALLTCGRGQRVGLFAGAGVGKTILIRQIASQSSADIIVIGLIGERGCEVRDVLEGGIEKKTVVVSATSDRSPMERARGARAATALAEYFRDRGENVLLIVDSLTRYAMALREIGLASGEPPATKGYPPSVFAELPRLLERVAPSRAGGSITAFYTVLVEGDDLADPVADSARSLLDGHIVLSRNLAARGHFPAIDVLASASRVARQVTPVEVQAIADRARSILASKREVDELRSLGAYTPGTSPEHDEALVLGAAIAGWSRQKPHEVSTFQGAIATLKEQLTKSVGAKR